MRRETCICIGVLQTVVGSLNGRMVQRARGREVEKIRDTSCSVTYDKIFKYRVRLKSDPSGKESDGVRASEGARETVCVCVVQRTRRSLRVKMQQDIEKESNGEGIWIFVIKSGENILVDGRQTRVADVVVVESTWQYLRALESTHHLHMYMLRLK